MTRLVERMQHYVFPGSVNAAAFLSESTPEGGIITFTANQTGVAGNAITVALVIAGNNTPFSVVVVGTAITINAATNAGGFPTQSYPVIAAGVNGTPAAAALVTSFGGSGAAIAAFGATNLAGGAGVAGGALSNGLVLQTDTDAPFRLFGVVIWALNAENFKGYDGEAAIRFTRPDGRLIQKSLTSTNLLFPGNQYNITGLSPNKAMVCPINPGVLYPANSTIQVDLLGLPSQNGSLAGFIIVFVGVKIFEEGAIWAPTYPQSWKARSYLDNVEVTLTAAQITGQIPVVNQPFTAQRDGDFVWQAGSYTDFPAGSSGITTPGQLVDLGVIVRDYTNKAYSNGWVPVGVLFPFLSTQFPGFLYPEIYVPTNQQLYFDFQYLYNGFVPNGANVTAILGLQGMKVYPQ